MVFTEMNVVHASGKGLLCQYLLSRNEHDANAKRFG